MMVQPRANLETRMRMAFHGPDARSRDEDNLVARMKAAIDGVADGLGVNDSRFKLASPEFGQPSKPGHVVVEVWQ